MRQSGASDEAIAFARALNFEAYLSDLKRAGKIDVGTVSYPFRANTNDEPVLLNGDPLLVQVWTEQGKVDPSRNSTYAAIKRQFPDAAPQGVPDFDSMRFANGGGQVFVYLSQIKTCHGCDVLAVERDAFEFDAGGHFLGAKLLGVDRKIAAKQPSSPPPQQATTQLHAANLETLVCVTPGVQDTQTWKLNYGTRSVGDAGAGPASMTITGQIIAWKMNWPGGGCSYQLNRVSGALTEDCVKLSSPITYTCHVSNAN